MFEDLIKREEIVETGNEINTDEEKIELIEDEDCEKVSESVGTVGLIDIIDEDEDEDEGGCGIPDPGCDNGCGDDQCGGC